MSTRRRRLVVVAASLLVASTASAVYLNAYSSFGYIWQQGAAVPYYVNPNNLYVSASAAVNALQAGASAWNGSGANVRLEYAGTTSGSSLTYNGKNEVFFRNDDGGGVLAETFWWASTTGALLDADIVFHQNHTWTTTALGCSSGVYVENTAAHEFGHVLGLMHSDVETATMWPVGGLCDTVRITLDYDDIAGVQALYPPTHTPSGTSPAPEPAPLPDPLPSSAPEAPSAPSPADGATGIQTKVTLRWSAPGATQYDVYINGWLYAGDVGQSWLDLSSLSGGTLYSWAVVAKNGTGSTASPAWSFTTKATTSKRPNRRQR